MAIDELPLPVVNFLNVIGVEWPYIDVRHEARCFLGEVEDLSRFPVAAGG